jgi:pyruvate-formate lyase
VKNLKKSVSKILKNKKILKYLVIIYRYNRKYGFWKTFIFSIKGIGKFYSYSLNALKGTQIKNVFSKINISIPKNGFIYSLDAYKVLNNKNRIIDNITIDYEKIINSNLKSFRIENEKMIDGDYKKSQKDLIDAIDILIDSEISALDKSNRVDKKEYITYFKNIKTKNATTFKEALQRILFFNQIMWQTNHMLSGLGRLDYILDYLYEKDLKNNKLSKDTCEKLLEDFCTKLHDYYWLKSNDMLGDTGQIIVLGGIDKNGKYFYSDLTYMFIKVINRLQLPDPKLILRVNSDTPRELIEKSLNCISTGIGSPLFANDDVICEKIHNFNEDDGMAYNYITSACWEPVVPGVSIGQNNVATLVYLKPFNDMLDNVKLDLINNHSDLMSEYKKELKEYIVDFVKSNDPVWEEDPLLSLFTKNCNKKQLDISLGGAKYNNYGYTSVSLSNTVNSILNINELVFNKKKYTLDQLNTSRKDNFSDKNIYNDLKECNLKFGSDDKIVLDITNDIIEFVSDTLSNLKNNLGGRFKFGFSSPSYISASNSFAASLDGRKNDASFGVHISSDYANPYTSLFMFASNIDYSNNKFNGNVVDFMASPVFIKNNFEKFVDFLIVNIKIGFFEMQMNVVSSKILIEAKNNPKAFPNLIVRVWGFSAYFNDLPIKYKDVLIERALNNEGLK